MNGQGECVVRFEGLVSGGEKSEAKSSGMKKTLLAEQYLISTDVLISTEGSALVQGLRWYCV